MSKSTLSSVVSNLVRASLGSSVSDSVADDDLDRHVADLILKEAKQKADRYGSEGYKAYLPGNTWSESNAPKTNKRFLSSIIKNTDEHNKTILRAQAQAAQDVRLERLEQEKKERKARAEEAVEAERLRRLMGKGGTEWGRDRDRGGKRDKDRKRRERSWERRDDDESERDDRKGKGSERREPREDGHDRRRRHRSRSPSEDDYERKRQHRSRRERSRSPRSTRHSDGEREDTERRRRSHRSKRSRSRDRRHRSRRDDTGHDRHRSRRRDDDRKEESTVNAADVDEPSSKPDREHASASPRSTQEDIDSEDPLARRRQRDETIEDTPRKRPRSKTPRSSSKDRVLEEHGEPHVDTPELARTEDDALRKRFDDKVAELRAKLSFTSKRGSQPRASSSRHHNSREVGPSSSRTLPSTRNPSPSPGPRPPSPSPDKSSRSKRSRHKAKDAPPPPPTSPPPLPAHLPSKMDKYFEESYDPRFDVAPLVAPSIPATGLISDAEFAGWDAMLEVIRRRREDKEDKKRLERMGIGKDKSKDSKNAHADDTSEVADIMSIEYKKRGAVREWDLGKEGF